LLPSGLDLTLPILWDAVLRGDAAVAIQGAPLVEDSVVFPVPGEGQARAVSALKDERG
jgi:hypothetical protein